MSSQRHDRVQEAIRQEASTILHNEIKDPRIGFLTVTRVELTNDLRFAKIFFTTLGEKKDRLLALKGLNSAKGYIKGRIADKLKLRFSPDIVFKVDDMLEHAQHVHDILEQLKKEKTDAKDDGGDKKV